MLARPRQLFSSMERRASRERSKKLILPREDTAALLGHVWRELEIYRATKTGPTAPREGHSEGLVLLAPRPWVSHAPSMQDDQPPARDDAGRVELWVGDGTLLAASRSLL